MHFEAKLKELKINNSDDSETVVTKVEQIRLLFDAKLISREKLCNLLDIDAKTVDVFAIFE
ncbi:MAG: hypothetical protein V8R64_16385 [Thomasclavelia sp.]